MSRESVEVVRQAFEAASRRPPDWEMVNALYDPQHEFVSWLSGLEGRSYVGAKGFVEWRAQMAETWSVWETEILDVRPVPDGRVVVRSRVKTKGQQSGVPFEREIGNVVTVGEGRIIHTEFFPTLGDALEAVGLRE